MNELTVFNNPEFGQVRILEVDGKPYAVGIDVARALQYAKPSQAIIDHCKGIRKSGIPSEGGTQETNIIPEGDIYRLTVKAASQSVNPDIKTKAERFESWIFDEVLPQIRSTGSYNTSTIDTSQLSPETQLILKLSQSIAQNELEQKRLRAAVQETKEEVQAIKAIIIINPSAEWRDKTNKILKTIGYQTKQYKDIQEEVYKALEQRGSCNLKQRLKNLQGRALLNGMSKSQAEALNNLDVLENDTRLKEIYIGIVKEMAIKYGVKVKEALS